MVAEGENVKVNPIAVLDQIYEEEKESHSSLFFDKIGNVLHDNYFGMIIKTCSTLKYE